MKSALLLLYVVVGLVSAAVNITVSGVSTGGNFAVQFHVAFSSSVNGAGIVAGAPYWCAQGDVLVAESSCMKYPEYISVDELVTATKYAYGLDTIDNPYILANSKVYLYSGTLDSVVNPGVVQKLLEYYKTFIPTNNIKTEFDIKSDHAMITNSYGNQCNFYGSPYINNCNYDAAGIMLNFIYGTLNTPVSPISSNIIKLGQNSFIPHGEISLASLGEDAYIYVPTNCSAKGSGCQVHIAFHGCEQTIADINTTFVTDTGYNGWAESNDIVVLYPQVIKTVLNPQGCWDWWGYTGENYATQQGLQMTTIKSMVDYIISTY